MNSALKSVVAMSILCSAAAQAAPQAQAPLGKRMNLAFVLLSEPKMPNNEDIARSFAHFASKGDHIRVVGSKAGGKGDTVGRSDSERLPVHYVQSPTQPSERVWRVDLK